MLLQLVIWFLSQLQCPAFAESADEEAFRQLQQLTFEIRGLEQLRANRTLTKSEYIQQHWAMRKAQEIARMQCVVPAFTFVKTINAVDDRGCSYWCLKSVTTHRDIVDALDFPPTESCFIQHFKAPWFMLYYDIRGTKMQHSMAFRPSPLDYTIDRVKNSPRYENHWDISRLKRHGALPDLIDERRPLDTCVCNFTLIANRMATPLANPIPWQDQYTEHYDSCTLSNLADSLAGWGWESVSYSYAWQHVACDDFLTPDNYSVPAGQQLLITRTAAEMMQDYEYKKVGSMSVVWSSFRKGFDNSMAGKRSKKSVVLSFDTEPIEYR